MQGRAEGDEDVSNIFMWMRKNCTKIFGVTSVMFLLALGYLCYVIASDELLKQLIFADPYTYEFYCAENDKCITVVIHSEMTFVDSANKKYVVYGKNEYKLPIKKNHIEYPEDTSLEVIWESKDKCLILSDQPPIKEMNLVDEVDIETVVSKDLM